MQAVGASVGRMGVQELRRSGLGVSLRRNFARKWPSCEPLSGVSGADRSSLCSRTFADLLFQPNVIH